MRWKSKYFFPVILSLVSLFAVKALLKPGFYTSHDGNHQIIRLMHFHQALADGQLPPRWAGSALNGYGYPLFIYTYRFPFWLGEFFYQMFHNLEISIKAVFILTYVLSGLSMYVLVKKLTSSKLAGFLSAFIYIWAPYRFVNIFVRASLGEAVTFMFVPLVFLGFYNLHKEKKVLWWIPFTAFILSGLLLSHALVFSLWLAPLALWFLFNLVKSENKKDYLKSSLLTGILSLFLTAYYWLPAFFEKKFIKVSQAIGSYYDAHFLTLKQLLYSKWGYGFSLPGVENDMMSFQIGIAQWLAVGTSFALILNALRLRAVKKQKNLCFLGFFILIFLASVLIMLSWSKPIYNFINKFLVIVIPWRFLGISVFSASMLAGLIIKVIKNKALKYFVFIGFVVVAFYTNRNHLRVNKYISFPDSKYQQSRDTSNEYDDYTPKWFEADKKLDDTDFQVLTVEGKSNNKLMYRQSNMMRFYSEVKTDKAQVLVRIAYYPGWEMLLDNKKQKVEHKNGRIIVNLDKGNHLITLLYRETKIRLYANWLSLLTLLFIAGFAYKYAKKKSKK